MKEYSLVNDIENKQYLLEMDESPFPKLEYIKTTGKIYLTHTEVPKKLRGKGLANQLVHKVLEDVKENNLELIPLCPFVALYIKNNPEYRSLVLKNVNLQ